MRCLSPMNRQGPPTALRIRLLRLRHLSTKTEVMLASNVGGSQVTNDGSHPAQCHLQVLLDLDLFVHAEEAEPMIKHTLHLPR